MPVLVIGMHRSGTSMVTRCVNLMGLSLGSGPLMEPKPDNPGGFWEQQGLTDFNDELLAQLGGEWRKPPSALARTWWQDEAMEPLRRKGTLLLAQTFGSDRSLWVWKDPRNCLTLPFWLDLICDKPIVIFVYRNPLEVWRSLERRNGMSKEEALALWEIYNWTALANLHNLPVFTVCYQSFIKDARAATAHIRSFVKRHLPEVRQSDVRHPEACVDPALQHWRYQANEVLEAADIGHATKELFRQLQHLPAECDALPSMPPPNHFWHHSFEVLERCATARARQQLARASALASELSSCQSRLATLHQELGAKNAEMQSLCTTLKNRDQTVRSLLEQVQRVNRQLQACHREIKKRDLRIRQLIDSPRDTIPPVLTMYLPRQHPHQKTIVVLGAYRGGTSMVAGTLRILGVFMGHKLGTGNNEDKEFQQASRREIRRLISLRNAEFDVWGWKDPKSISQIRQFHNKLRNPYFIIIFRDVLAVTQKQLDRKHRVPLAGPVRMPQPDRCTKPGVPHGLRSFEGDELGILLQELRDATRQERLLAKFAIKHRYPMLLVSYERTLRKRAQFVDALIQFLDLPVSAEVRSKAVAWISPGGSLNVDGYLRQGALVQAA